MPVIINLQVVAESSNFEWRLTDEQAKELQGRIHQIHNGTSCVSSDFRCRLSYRGLTIKSVQGRHLASTFVVHGGVVSVPAPYGDCVKGFDSGIEQWVLDTAADAVPDNVKLEIMNELSWLWFTYAHYA